MFSLFTIVSFATIMSSQAQGGGMMCSFCVTIITNTQDAFGPSIVNASDVKLFEYFRKECPRYAIKSAMLAGECEYLVSNHPLILFRDLRSQKSPLDTCMDLSVC
ncbi:hypothetical protein RB195_004180 [Necator americanus]|uniref:Saposin B-type domain-containing protein n=1 Tax=Necator americanus TaxID=51031 RepID=A0ABR1BGP5_NECAM